MDELEVFFCDLCNTSVPEVDLDSGAAARRGDKIVGSCCLTELRAGAPKTDSAGNGGGGARGASLAGAFIVLIAIAGATVFLDWRFGEEADAVASSVRSVRDNLRPVEDRLGSIERRFEATLTSSSLAPLEAGVRGLPDEIAGIEERVVQSVRGNATRLRELQTQLQALDSGQRDHLARIAELHGELRRVSDRVDDVVTEIREVGATGRAAVPLPIVDPAPPATDSRPSPAALPEALVKFVDQLTDPDDGARFEAVDELLQSGDQRVFPHILPLATDADPFVRRLVFEGLKDHRSPESVDALIDALGDDESLVRYTAHASLKALTQQDLPFDPDASSAKRSSMQRRWQDWWSKNRDGMF